MITALAGGVGAAKLLDGLARVMPPQDISVVVNTGDDINMYGLYISPDLDIVTYTLAGLVNPQMGWGFVNDTFYGLDSLVRFYETERWFNLGDRDFATHVFRTDLLRQGYRLTEVASRIRQTLGVETNILPMTDLHTPTMINTDRGEMHFQEYLVKHRAHPEISGIRFDNIEQAQVTPEVTNAIMQAEAIVICPSNPIISIGPILAVPGMRDLLKQTPAPIIAVSSIVGGQSLKGPSDRMMRQANMAVTATEVARLYSDFLDAFILDEQDAALKEEIESLGLKTFVTNTVMSGATEKYALALFTMQAIKDLQNDGNHTNVQAAAE
jgi:LPPG:FO 2-phospho-L-lactate transferase